MKTLIIIIMLACVIGLLCIMRWFLLHPCIRSHQEWVAHPAYVYFMNVNKIRIPISVPAQNQIRYNL
jgi:hypothetical protein